MSHALIFLIVGVSVACVILRPWGVKEFYPAVAGAVALVLLGLLPWRAAWRGVGQGTDVMLFLTGMMVLAELASGQGLFDWLAGLVARAARGSALGLFALIYAMAVVVTVFLSNDATAVVFTPAVAAMARGARVARPLPYLLICAFVANAASFVLPISNPANLVVYGAGMPPLVDWLREFGPASVAAVAATFLLLWMAQRGVLRGEVAMPEVRPVLASGGRRAGIGIVMTALVLMGCSALGLKLGLPTFCAALGTAALVLVPARQAPWGMAKHISWGILPLVAGLFVMVAALDQVGVAAALARWVAALGPHAAFWGVGLGLGVLTNLVNNLPGGLLAGHALAQAHMTRAVTGAAMVGVDLGPNLSVTGSLATILWLTALRREGVAVSAWQFLRLGAVIMPPALVAALICLALTR